MQFCRSCFLERSLWGSSFRAFFTRSRGGVRVSPPWFQDILAWLALLATLGMGAYIIIQTLINPGLEEERRIPVFLF